VSGAGLPDPASLDVHALAGQLVCVALRDHTGDPRAREAFLADLERRGWGGVIVFGGDLAAVSDLLAEAATRCPVPPLATGDFERGLGQQFPASGTTFPPLMALAAAADPALALAVGRAAGREIAAAGFHVNYAPVADLAIEPANPIVATRAAGDDPGRAGEIVAAVVGGLQDAGVAATIKHVPGHGRTTVDSHDVLPVVEASREDLEEVDLEPFRAGVAAGARLAMTAHVAFPALEPDGARDRPATFSRAIVTGVLRKRLGFAGLVCSDALMMGAVAGAEPVERARRAIEAGVDWLLYPSDPAALADALAGALAADAALRARAEDACATLFGLKRWARAGEPPPDHPPVSAAALAEAVASEALTADPPGPPAGTAWPDRAQWIIVLDGAIGEDAVVLGEGITPEAAERIVVVDTERPGDEVGRRIDMVREACRGALVACAVFSPVRAWKGRAGLSEAGREAVEAACSAAREAVLLNFSDPRIVETIDAPSRVVQAYGEDSAAQRAVLAFLRGARSAEGRRPLRH